MYPVCFSYMNCLYKHACISFPRYDDVSNDTERLSQFDEALPGSAMYGTVRILTDSDTCSRDSGSECSWLPLWSGGRANVTSRDYSIQAMLEPGNCQTMKNYRNFPSYINACTTFQCIFELMSTRTSLFQSVTVAISFPGYLFFFY